MTWLFVFIPPPFNSLPPVEGKLKYSLSVVYFPFQWFTSSPLTGWDRTQFIEKTRKLSV
jgi:hypothetical protein